MSLLTEDHQIKLGVLKIALSGHTQRLEEEEAGRTGGAGRAPLPSAQGGDN